MKSGVCLCALLMHISLAYLYNEAKNHFALDLVYELYKVKRVETMLYPKPLSKIITLYILI